MYTLRQATEADYAASGKARHFELLRGAIAGGRDSLPYAELAATLGLSEDAARQAASRRSSPKWPARGARRRALEGGAM